MTFALSALCDMTHLLDADDQYRFYTSSARAMATARRRGDERRLKYWPGELAVSIKLLPWANQSFELVIYKANCPLTFFSLSLTRTPVPRPWSELHSHAQVEISSGIPNKIGPFLYNPRRSLTNKVSAYSLRLIQFFPTSTFFILTATNYCCPK